MDDRESQVREIFTEVVALPQSEWAALLERRCQDPAVRARVQALLDLHVMSNDFLSRPAVETFGAAASMGGQIAEFRIVREIGRGGMGVVYLAEDTVLKRSVALKVMPPYLDTETSTADRFRKEAQAVARLSHPGIVQIYRSGEERGFSYIAMEYVEGETLEAQLARRPADSAAVSRRPGPVLRASGSGHGSRDGRAHITESARLVSELADALDHAHRQGVIHRDVKPSNILIDRDQHARLTDFGVARIVTERTLLNAGDIAGSYPYMSPEQARVQAIDIDHRSDIFSLGVVLYELLTQARPFDGPTPQAILRALSDGRPRGLRQLNPTVSADLATVCHKAIEKLPKDRYQSAAHMAADLRCWLDGRPILAAPPTWRRRIAGVIGRRRATIGKATVLLLIVALALAGWGLKRLHDEKFAWLDVDAGTMSCGVFIQKREMRSVEQPDSGGNAWAGRWVPEATPLGRTPMRRVRLKPGQYRLTLVGADGVFAEFNLVLETGKENAKKVRGHLPTERADYSAQDTLFGVLRAGDDDELGPMISFGRMHCRAASPVDGDLLAEEVDVAPFLIDERKVSNREYKAFVDATKYPMPLMWRELGYPADCPDLPVIGVTLEGAEAYARWRGKRLPTLFEWQAASRGIDGKLFPPGHKPELERLADPAALRDAASADDKVFFNFYKSKAYSVFDDARQPSVGALRQPLGNCREYCADVNLSDNQYSMVGRGWTDLNKTITLAEIGSGPLSVPAIQNGFRCAKSASRSMFR